MNSPIGLPICAGLLAVAAIAVAVSLPAPQVQAQALNGESKLTVLDAPCVIHDSASATGTGFSGPYTPGVSRRIPVTGVTGPNQGGSGECVPNTVDATGVVLSAAALDPVALGNLRISEADVAAGGGVVNYSAGGPNNSNTVTVPLSANGEVDVEANVGPTDVRLSVIGYYSSTGTLSYQPLTPCAAADSRSGTGQFAGPFGPGNSIPDIDVVGTFSATQGGGNSDCGVPIGAEGVVINVVAIDPSASAGALAVGKESTAPAQALTYFHQDRANSATAMVQLGTGGKVAAALIGPASTHFRLVVLGYLSSSQGSPYTPLNPCAAFDSRPTNPQGNPTGDFAGRRTAGSSGLNSTGTTTYQISGSIPAAQGGLVACGVPPTATAVLINVIALDPVAYGNFRAFATGSNPTGGVVNFGPGSPNVNSNAIVVGLSAGGQMDLFVNAPANDGDPTVHARGVVLGYYAPTQGVQMLAVGDMARCDLSSDEAVGELMDRLPDQPILGLGDLAYSSGTITEFNNCFGPPFGRHKSQFLPVPGNHEYYTANAAGYYQYFGAAAGDPTKGYYSHTQGDWLFLFLNTNCSAIGGCGVTSPQYLWLQSQLASAPVGSCIAVTTHHPRWSSYANYTDQSFLAPMVDLLVAHQADVMFSGHSHHYERLAKVDGLRQLDPAGMAHFTVGTGGTSLRTIDPDYVLAETSYWTDSNHGVLSVSFADGGYGWQFINTSDEVFDSGYTTCNDQG